MQLGFVHFDRSDQKKYLSVLSKLSEEGAIDELGIGRIRDWYSDRMFPGISSLQRHAKYFTVLPLLYRYAAGQKFSSRSEVRKHIIKLEVELTKAMIAANGDKPGITGSSVVMQPGSKYVKYDPTYIYGNGLVSYGIIKFEDIDEMVFQQSRLLHNDDDRFEGSEDEPGDLLMTKTDIICDYAPLDLDWDFLTSCSLDLTKNEALFLSEHMTKGEFVEGSLLKYIIDNRLDLTGLVTFQDFVARYADLPNVPDGIREKYIYANHFASLVRGLFLRYNFLYSEGADCGEEFEGWLRTEYVPQHDQMAVSLELPRISEYSSVRFCKEAMRLIDEEQWEDLDELIRRREISIKGSRRKIGTENYEGRIHDYYLSYRWDTTKTVLTEIMEGLAR